MFTKTAFLNGLALLAATAALTLPHAGTARAQAPAPAAPPTLAALAARLTADETQRKADEAHSAAQDAKIAALQTTVSSQAATISTLQSRKAATPNTSTTTTTYGPFTVSGSDVYLTGYNLHIQSGSGSTYGTINGKGNLIIGYNETRGGSADLRTGSHNLILGAKNNYSGYGGLVAGVSNGITNGYATVTGGNGNRAIGNYSSVSGGQNLTASAAYELEPAGAIQTQVTTLNNTQTSQGVTLSGLQTTVAQQGTITGLFSLANGVGTNTELTLSGVNLHVVNGMGSTETQNGLGNLIVGYNESRGGSADTRTGSHNIVTGVYNNFGSSGGIIGGYDNSLSGVEEFCVGTVNTVGGNQSAISGGYGNVASGNISSVSGGQGNTASGGISSVSGGLNNTASGPQACVSGGFLNTASGSYSSVSGGYQNTAGSANNGYADLTSVSGGANLAVTNNYGWAAGSDAGTGVSGNFSSD